MLWAPNEVCGFSSKISVQSFFVAFSITTIGHCFMSRLNYSNRLRPAFSKFLSPPQIQIHFHPPQSNPAHLRMCSQVLSAQNSSLAPSRHKGNVTFWPGPMRPSTSLITPSQNVPQTPQLIPTSHLALLPLPCPRCPLCTFPTFFQFFSSMNSSAQKSFLTPAMLPLSCPPNSNITTYYK